MQNYVNISGTSHGLVQTAQFFNLAEFDQIMLETQIQQLIQHYVNISGTSHGLVHTVQLFALATFDQTMF